MAERKAPSPPPDTPKPTPPDTMWNQPIRTGAAAALLADQVLARNQERHRCIFVPTGAAGEPTPAPQAPGVIVGVDWGAGDDWTVGPMGARARRRQRRAAEQLLADIQDAEDQAFITGRPAAIGGGPVVVDAPEPKLVQLRRGTWWALVNGPDDLPVLFDGFRVAVESADQDEYPVAVVVMERAEWETAQRQHRAIFLALAVAVVVAALL